MTSNAESKSTIKGSVKRKATLTFAAEAKGEGEMPAFASTSSPQTATESPHEGTVTHTGANAQTPPAKKRKKSFSTSKKATSVPSPAKAITTIKPPQPPAQLSNIIFAKIKQVRASTKSSHDKQVPTTTTNNAYVKQCTALERIETKMTLVSMAESIVVSALMRLKLHYEMGDPNNITLDEVDIVSRYEEQRVQFAVRCVTVDVASPTRLEESIKRKIVGHGLEDANLLAIELEMVEKAEAEWFTRAKGVETSDRHVSYPRMSQSGGSNTPLDERRSRNLVELLI